MGVKNTICFSSAAWHLGAPAKDAVPRVKAVMILQSVLRHSCHLATLLIFVLILTCACVQFRRLTSREIWGVLGEDSREILLGRYGD